MESMAGLKGKKIIVTGGAGFIGSHVVKKLISEGANVIVVDVAVKENSFFSTEGLYKQSDFKLVDVRDRYRISHLISDKNPDFIIHLAAKTLVTDSFNTPYDTFETNIMGTVNILEAARKQRMHRVIVASSDKAYGKSLTPYRESNPLKGDHPYDVSKSSADLIAMSYFHSYKLPVIVTRCANVYGEGDINFDRIIPGIVQAYCQNQPLVVRSNGKYVRDYVYAEDVAEAYLRLLLLSDKYNGHAFNISSKDKYSVLEVVSLFNKAVGTNLEYIVENTAQNEIPYQHLVDKKIRSLGWANKTSMKERLPHIVEWYKRIL